MPATHKQLEIAIKNVEKALSKLAEVDDIALYMQLETTYYYVTRR